MHWRQRVNVKFSGGEARLRKHYKLFRAFWASLVEVAECLIARGKGGGVAWEWPASCSY